MIYEPVQKKGVCQKEIYVLLSVPVKFERKKNTCSKVVPGLKDQLLYINNGITPKFNCKVGILNL